MKMEHLIGEYVGIQNYLESRRVREEHDPYQITDLVLKAVKSWIWKVKVKSIVN